MVRYLNILSNITDRRLGQGSSSRPISAPPVFPTNFSGAEYRETFSIFTSSNRSIYIPQVPAGVSSIQISSQLPETDVDISTRLELTRINIHCDHVPTLTRKHSPEENLSWWVLRRASEYWFKIILTAILSLEKLVVKFLQDFLFHTPFSVPFNSIEDIGSILLLF